MGRAWVIVLLVAFASCRYGFERIAGDATSDEPTADTSDTSIDAPPAKNRVFMTSAAFSVAQVRARGSGDMLAGGDAICADAATTAGLAGPFVALLSSSTTNAIDRLAGSRGWYRLDDKPFADTTSSLFGDLTVDYPVLSDELGDTTPARIVMTGTNQDGLVGNTCLDWASASPGDSVNSGLNSDGGQGWSSRYIPGCDALDLHLYCFGIGHDVPVTITPQIGRRIFVSKPWLPGGGITSADAQCQAEADAATLGGQYRALLATSTASASSRFSTAGPTWVRVDGVPVAATAADLFAKLLLAAPTMRADRINVVGVLWSGASSPTAVSPAGRSCLDWVSALSSQMALEAVASDGPSTFMSETYTDTCNRAHPVYCLER